MDSLGTEREGDGTGSGGTGPVAASGQLGAQRVVARALALAGEGDDLLAIDRDVVGGLDPDPHRVAIDLHDRDPDLRAQLEPLTELPAQDQHGLLLLESTLGKARPRSASGSHPGRTRESLWVLRIAPPMPKLGRAGLP